MRCCLSLWFRPRLTALLRSQLYKPQPFLSKAYRSWSEGGGVRRGARGLLKTISAAEVLSPTKRAHCVTSTNARDCARERDKRALGWANHQESLPLDTRAENHRCWAPERNNSHWSPGQKISHWSPGQKITGAERAPEQDCRWAPGQHKKRLGTSARGHDWSPAWIN